MCGLRPLSNPKRARPSQHLPIGLLQGTFGQGEVMDAVQYIRFSAPIPSQQAIDLRAKGKLAVKVVFKLNEV